MAISVDALTLHYYECSNESYTLDLGGGVDLTLMLIPAGEFMMGAADSDDDGRSSERPQHRVQLPNSFLMGATPVTQAQWRVVAGYDAENIALEGEPSHFNGNDLPVEKVSWNDATEFCQRLSRRTEKLFQLPSEAQWEYACRAGTETAYHFGNQVTLELANYAREVGQTTAVRRYPPNRWGLYDMHGNMYEWCQDPWHNNYEGASMHEGAWMQGGDDKRRVIRGGSWINDPRDCCSASRYLNTPAVRYYSFGFRVSCVAPRALQ